MQYKLIGILIVAFALAGAAPLRADDPTSKFVSLAPISSSLAPGGTGVAAQFEVWDQATAGTMISTEAHTVDTDEGSNIRNDSGFADLLLGRPAGLNAANFPAGSSRYLDVTQGGASVLAARLPIYASIFSLTPGPQGPAGPTGAQGPQGPPGVVQTVTGDASIMVSGTAADRLVSIAPFGVTDAAVARGALDQSKIAGTAAILNGSNTFNGPLAVAPRSTGYGLRIDQGADGHGLLSYVNTTSSAKVVFAAASLAAGGLNVMGDGNVGIGTGTPIASLHVAGGNLNLDNSSAASGNILKGGNRFIHNFGGNTFIGINAGNLTMMSSANNNTGAGINALSALTTGCCNTANGNNALLQNTAGSGNTAAGDGALSSNSTGSNNTAIGRAALISNSTARVIRPSASVRSRTTAPAPATPQRGFRRCRTTPRVTTTLPLGVLRSPATPLASPTLLVGSLRSPTTPSAHATPPAAS